MQADLFNLSISNSFERQAFQKSFFEKKYTLRLDQLLGLGLVAILFFVLVFAWGAEHGKAVSRREYMLHAVQNTLEKSVSSPVAAAPVLETPSVAVAPSVEVATESRHENLAVSAPIATPVSSSTATTPSSVASKAKYTIAHITYVKKDQAMAEIERIKSKGFTAFLSPSGRYFQICVSGFETRKIANDAIKNLKLKGIVSPDSYIRNMPSGS